MGGTSGDRRLNGDADVADAARRGLGDVAPGDAAVVAMSGGADSLGLARLVTQVRPDVRAIAVHVRHGLREDAGDARTAVTQATALGLPVHVVDVTVTRTGGGVEAAAREARLSALAAAAQAGGAAWVLTGHTADDQAETVLLNLARGAGLPGLAGIPASRPLAPGVRLLHPLLAIRRSALREVAAAAGLPIAQDPTNDDPLQRRARARHGLLPALAELTGQGSDPVAALARLAAHARRDTDALDAWTSTLLTRHLRRWGPAAVLAESACDGLPAAIVARLVRGLVQAAADDAPPPSWAAVEAVLDLGDGRRLDLPGGIRVSRGSGVLAAVVRRRDGLPERRGVATIPLPELGVSLRAGAPARTGVLPPWAPPSAASAVAVRDGATLTVRSRRAGDRIVTAAGTQSVADAMVGARVPRAARDLVPVISDEDGVLWVPGVAVRAGPAGARVLQLVPERAK